MQKQYCETAIYWIAGFVLLYVLSIGPVAALCRNGYVSVNCCQALYLPLEALPIDRMPGATPALYAYVGWWANL